MKFNTAALDVQELVTLAEVQGSPVVVDHTVIVAAVPGSHCCPVSHFRLEYFAFFSLSQSSESSLSPDR